MSDSERAFMRRALQLARTAEQVGEVPVGAIVVRDGEIIGEGFNQPIGTDDPTAHAEIIALRNAAKKLGNYRVTGSTLYVTLEPCPMCVGAMMHARVARLVFGAQDPKTGAAGGADDITSSPTFQHSLEIEGDVLADEAGALLRSFFAARR